MISLLEDPKIYVWGIKIIIELILFISVIVSLVNLKQTMTINSSIRTKLSGFINFLSLLKVIFLGVSIFLVVIA
ncbi:MAG: hypothetical protein WCK31_03795 [bacterium]